MDFSVYPGMMRFRVYVRNEGRQDLGIKSLEIGLIGMEPLRAEWHTLLQIFSVKFK